MAEESVKDAQNEARATDNLRTEVSKSLATAESKNKDLVVKFATTNRDRKSVEASLKTTEV